MQLIRAYVCQVASEAASFYAFDAESVPDETQKQGRVPWLGSTKPPKQIGIPQERMILSVRITAFLVATCTSCLRISARTPNFSHSFCSAMVVWIQGYLMKPREGTQRFSDGLEGRYLLNKPQYSCINVSRESSSHELKQPFPFAGTTRIRKPRRRSATGGSTRRCRRTRA